MQDCVIGLPLCNTFVNGLEGRVKISLIILTGLLNWKVPLTPGRRGKMCGETGRSQTVSWISDYKKLRLNTRVLFK